MKANRFALVTIAIASLVSGCGAPTPTKVCDHMLELMKKSPEKQLSAEEIAEVRKTCISGMEEEATKDPEGFKKFGKCMLGAEKPDDIDRCGEEAKPAE